METPHSLGRNFKYTYHDPNAPDAIAFIKSGVGILTFKDQVMRNATPIRKSGFGPHFEIVRTIGELTSIVCDGTSGITQREAIGVLPYLDGQEMRYNERYASGFLRIERVDSNHYRFQDFPWSSLSC